MNIVVDISNLKEYLDRLDNAREILLKKGRDILNLCRLIIAKTISGGNVENVIDKLRQRFLELYDSIKPYPELTYSNLFYSIAIEYVETLQTHSIIKHNKILSLKDLEVHPIPYILGLTEVLGELKRFSLELVRKDRIDEAYKILEIAEEIYNTLSSFTYPETFLPGFRHKLDVYRKVIDDWKRFLIDMGSRKSLIHKLNDLLKQSEHKEYDDISGEII